MAAQRAVGVRTEDIGRDEVQKLWPVADLEPFAAFAWEERGGYGDAYQTAQAFASAARREGARLRQSTTVTEIIVNGGSASGVRLADGSVVSAGTVVVAAAVLGQFRCWQPMALSCRSRCTANRSSSSTRVRTLAGFRCSPISYHCSTFGPRLRRTDSVRQLRSRRARTRGSRQLPQSRNGQIHRHHRREDRDTVPRPY